MLIPFAAAGSAAGREAQKTLSLPHLDKLLARMTLARTDEGDAQSLSTPLERARARAWGMEAPDGCIPWAARWAHEEGRDMQAAWALITPCHWRVGASHVEMDHPAKLGLTPAESQVLLEAMRPWFEQDGIQLFGGTHLWLASGEVFRDLPTASIDRVAGQQVDPWMPQGERARPLRRLQQEMQMLLYTHPLNDERERRKLPAVNSFWVSGTGRLAAGFREPTQETFSVDALILPAALEDWPAWTAAWRQLDDTACADFLERLERGERVSLTLCGSRSAKTWTSDGGGLWRRMGNIFRRESAADILETL